MSGVVISNRIAHPAVRGVAQRVTLKDDQIISLWYESGCRYIERMSQQVHRSGTYYTLFAQVIRRDSFRHTPVSQVFVRIQESPVFWDFWARVLKLICQEFSASIEDRSDLERYLYTYNNAPYPWVIDEIFPKN